MSHLVAIDLPAVPAVDALRRVWDAGDAALVIDQRLPPAGRHRLLDALKPTAIVDGTSGPGRWRRLDGASHGDGVPPMLADDALVVATSGTTGEPKGVVLTHTSVAAHARAVHAHLAVDPTTDRWLACLPLAHVGGLGVVTRALVTGTPFSVLDRFDPEIVSGASRRPGPCTLVSLVPTALDRADTSAYRWVVLGGSADPSGRASNVVRTYGLTESGGGVVYDGTPLDGVEVRIVEGEIQLRGPMLLRAYRDGIDPRDADGWLRTGDLGSLDTAGVLTVDGRRSDLIVTGGENVWPESVEAVVASHPLVAEVAVAGKPDDEWGQRVTAFVVPVSGHEPPTLDELRNHTKRSLPAFAAPRELVLVEALPRTPLGKVRRRDLAQ